MASGKNELYHAVLRQVRSGVHGREEGSSLRDVAFNRAELLLVTHGQFYRLVGIQEGPFIVHMFRNGSNRQTYAGQIGRNWR